MYKFIFAFISICFITLVGCSESTAYNDEDVAAIVREEEITIGELRFLYPDEEMLNMLDGTIKATLVIQEAKHMNIDVSEEVKETTTALGAYPPDDIDTPAANSTRDFVEPQAKKLELEPEEYYQKYNEMTTEIGAYINAYIQEVLGEPSDDIEKYQKNVNEHLDELVQDNEDEIMIFMND